MSLRGRAWLRAVLCLPPFAGWPWTRAGTSSACCSSSPLPQSALDAPQTGDLLLLKAGDDKRPVVVAQGSQPVDKVIRAGSALPPLRRIA